MSQAQTMPSACPELAGGRRAREKPACLAPQDMEKADVHVSAAEQSFFPPFFLSNLAPGLWDEIPALAGSQGVHIPLEKAH